MKVISAILALLLILSGCAADKQPETTTMPVVPTTTVIKPTFTVTGDMKEFSRWLDLEKMQPGLSVDAFIDQLSRYSYHGSPVTEELLGCYSIDGAGYGGTRGSWEGLIFENYSHIEDNWAQRGNRITINQFPEGMQNPFGLQFGDTLTKVLSNFVNGFDPYEDFKADEPSKRWEMTLYSDLSCRFYLTNSKLKFDDQQNYTLTYTYSGMYVKPNGRVENLDRSVILQFNGPEDRLVRIVLDVSEDFPWNG